MEREVKTTYNKERWILQEDSGELSILRGFSDGHGEFKIKESLFLREVSEQDLNNRIKFLGGDSIGYLTLYLYKVGIKKGIPLPVIYEFYIKRVDNKIHMYVKPNINSSFKDNQERLKIYDGFEEFHKNIVNMRYEVDIDKILINAIIKKQSDKNKC